MEGCVDTAVNWFLETYSKYVYMFPAFEVEDITAEMVQESFSRTKESAGALDGWSPKELSMLSLKAYGKIAVMLRQIEAGAPWPRASLPARVIYLLKEGAKIGQVTSYRPLTISAPIYRCWATMRLREAVGLAGNVRGVLKWGRSMHGMKS